MFILNNMLDSVVLVKRVESGNILTCISGLGSTALMPIQLSQAPLKKK